MPGDLVMLSTAASANPRSAFPPLAVGFFGLGVGCLVYGPQELFGFPRRSPESDRTMGLWGIWVPGFLQTFAGVLLFVGLDLLDAFGQYFERPLYMAALALVAYGLHWVVLGRTRFLGADPQPHGLAAIPFGVLSAVGAVIFAVAGDWPVTVMFVGLTLVYVTTFVASLDLSRSVMFTRLLGAVRVLTGIWLMYLTCATVLDLELRRGVPT